MGKRFAVAIGLAALGAAMLAAGASADFRSVNDPRGDSECFGHPCSHQQRRNADLVRAGAGHERGRLKHTIRVVGKIQSFTLVINTDSDPGCEFELDVLRGGREPSLYDCNEERFTGSGRVDFHRHSVEIRFSKRSIGNPCSYGWDVITASREAGGLGPWAYDLFLKEHEYIEHRHLC